MGEIINRQQKSKVKEIDLEDYYPSQKRLVLDIAPWLYEGLVLREKEFRSHLDSFDWSFYKDTYVALCCTSDAVVPFWAYLLVTTKLSGICKKVVKGSLAELETALYVALVDEMDLSVFENQVVIVKGCSNKAIPDGAYIRLMERLTPIARKTLFGEKCSAVPLSKKKRT